MRYIDAEKLKDEIKHLKIDVYDEAHQFDLGARSSLTFLESFIDSLTQETSEISLEKFTEKMEDWKARYNHPDNIPIKATMAFTARMFYMYPDTAREWYDDLPKVTQD